MIAQDVNLFKKDLLRPDEVADFFSISTNTIYRWIEEKKLKASKIGGTIRITKEAVEDLIKATII